MTVTELRPYEGSRERPPAAPTRWRPARAGIVNVWRYYDETFHFHEGRLLLRGPNGTGKSKALELLLPYLFDANLRPSRLSTFGGSERTMYWNLMGDGYEGVTRVGYVWLEFGRIVDDGTEHWFTCGARLQASKNGRSAAATYFTTTLRPGVNLSLTTPDGRPLTKADLGSALDGHGELYESATGDYRRAVRHALFPEFTAEQYEALINALLQLRTPKLSEHLNPDELSKLLSEALPALDQGDVAEIAEGFEKLDRRREELTRLEGEVAAAETLATRARNYSRRVLRAGAAALISATTEMDNATRRARRAQETYDEASGELAALEHEQEELENAAHRTEQRTQGLAKSEAYTEGLRLDELRQAVERAERRAGAAHEEAAARAAEAGEAAEAAESRRVETHQMGEAAKRARDETSATAQRAVLIASFEDAEAADDLAAARRAVRVAVEARGRQIGEVRRAVLAHQRAVAERTAADTRLERVREERAAAERRVREVTEAYDTALGLLRDKLRAWAAALRSLSIQGDELAARAEDETAVQRIVADAAALVGERLAAERTRLTAERDELAAERDLHESERAALRADKIRTPEPPATRTADRSALPGGPLWRLVDWRPDVPDGVQAGVEAAMEASGLLDAWVLPSGEVTVAGHDTFAEPMAAPVGPTLADVLAVDRAAQVPADRLTMFLRGIAYEAREAGGQHPAAIGADGTWRLGTLHGSWAKDAAGFIGAAAQQRARERRIAELTTQIEAIGRQLDRIENELATNAARREAVRAEKESVPRGTELRALAKRLTDAEAGAAAKRDAEAAAESERDEADRRATGTLRELALTASEHRLPTDEPALDAVADAVRTYESVATAWLDRRAQHQAAALRAGDASRQADRARRIATEAAERAAELAREADGHRAECEAVEQAVGADYREVLDEMARLRRQLEELRARLRLRAGRHRELNQRVGGLKVEKETLRQEGETKVAARDTAAARFRHLHAAGFSGEARLDAELTEMPGAKATLEAARTVAEELAAVPHEPRNIKDAEHNLSQARYQAQEALAGRADLTLEQDDQVEGVVRLVATVDGVRMGAAGLHELLRTELAESRTHLTEDEQALFDRTLTGETRRQVAARIRLAEELKDSMNAQLQRVRTVSGLRIKLDWRVDPELPPAVREARDLLLRDPASLSEHDRSALHAFFRDRIDEVRTADTAAGWEQQLLQVLDYRNWHQFVVQMKKSDAEEWTAITKRRHGALSGGEKAISLHLPLFAAAAAHYRAAPQAPRPILLDEVFVGVDEGNRGQLLDLLVKLDLDMVLTSDHEWCTYRELDGIAVHQLVTGEDDDAVTTVRFVWDGSRVREDDPEPAPRPVPTADEPSLFDER
ncbi:MAG TPA: TIGR02680 family protein [Streptosporangiaceae bacterium]